MQRKPLGRTGITVPRICLGTMTWGTQNTESEAHAQMDLAMNCGVDFFDTAELYPTTPQSAEVQGRTEEYIGNWFAARGRRDDVILATKVSGKGTMWIRGGAPVTPEGIGLAVETSLRRLRTDYIDLYQVHWPNRGHYHFRRQWRYDPSGQDGAAVRQDIADTLGALGRLVDAGKIRAAGLSNETVWGTMQYLAIAEAGGLPRIASVQNEYSLLYRTFDTDFAEAAHHEDVGLLAYSPLAAGILTGKYSGGTIPAGSRAGINKGLGGRFTPAALAAADDYAALARDHGLDPAQLALAFCLTRPFMTSVIIGATDPRQLDLAIGAAELRLDDEVMEGIAALHRRHPAPY